MYDVHAGARVPQLPRTIKITMTRLHFKEIASPQNKAPKYKYLQCRVVVELGPRTLAPVLRLLIYISFTLLAVLNVITGRMISRL